VPSIGKYTRSAAVAIHAASSSFPARVVRSGHVRDRLDILIFQSGRPSARHRSATRGDCVRPRIAAKFRRGRRQIIRARVSCDHQGRARPGSVICLVFAGTICPALKSLFRCSTFQSAGAGATNSAFLIENQQRRSWRSCLPTLRYPIPPNSFTNRAKQPRRILN